MIEVIISIILLIALYVLMAYLGHNDPVFSIVPNWLCIFCLFDYIKNNKIKITFRSVIRIIFILIVIQIIFLGMSFSKTTECRELHDHVFEYYINQSDNLMKERTRGMEWKCLDDYRDSLYYKLSIFKYEEFWDYGG